MTNADKLRGMSVHDMAGLIFIALSNKYTIMEVMEWLQTEVEE